MSPSLPERVADDKAAGRRLLILAAGAQAFEPRPPDRPIDRGRIWQKPIISSGRPSGRQDGAT